MTDPSTVEFIPLTHGYTAMVDADLYSELSRYKWHAFVTPTRAYARRGVYKNGVKGAVFLHHQVLPQKNGFTVDHKYSDTPFLVLDERRNNLRYATVSQQGANRKKNSGHSLSKFKGVCWHKHKKKWCAAFETNKKCNWLGYFISEEAAAMAYDAAVLKCFGEFARLNFPNGKEHNVV